MRLADLDWHPRENDPYEKAGTPKWLYAEVQKPGTNTWVRVARATEHNSSWAGRYSVRTYIGHPLEGHITKAYANFDTGYCDALEAQCLLYEIFATQEGNDAAG
jgi:hypothetical protein